MEKAIMVMVSLLLFIYQHVVPMCLLVVTEIPDGHICSEDGLKSFGKIVFKAFLYGMAG